MKYLVENTKDTHEVVTGLGVIEPHQTREFTSDEAAGFAIQNGVKLLQTNVPDGVTVTVKTEEM